MATAPPKTRLRGAQRRELIVGAAVSEFAQRGYEAASVGRIAQAAGVSRTVLYDHFPSKSALFGELLRTQYGALLSFLSEPIASQAPMRERMPATYDAFLRFVQERPLAWRLLFPSHPPIDPQAAAVHRAVSAESNRVLADLLAPDARRAGADPESEIGHLIFTITLDAMHGAARWWNQHPEVSRADVLRGVTATLWTGMGAVDRGRGWVE